MDRKKLRLAKDVPGITALFFGLLFIGLPALSYADTQAEIQKNVESLIQTKSCVNCNLAGADLTRLDLNSADLSGANLAKARFQLADLSGANLSGADLKGAEFGGADLAGANLSGADLRGANLTGAYTAGSQMDGTLVDMQEVDGERTVEVYEKVYIPDDAKSKDAPKSSTVAIENEQDEDVAPDIAEVPQTAGREEWSPTTDLGEQAALPIKTVAPVGHITIIETLDKDGAESGGSSKETQKQEAARQDEAVAGEVVELHAKADSKVRESGDDIEQEEAGAEPGVVVLDQVAKSPQESVEPLQQSDKTPETMAPAAEERVGAAPVVPPGSEQVAMSGEELDVGAETAVTATEPDVKQDSESDQVQAEGLVPDNLAMAAEPRKEQLPELNREETTQIADAPRPVSEDGAATGEMPAPAGTANSQELVTQPEPQPEALPEVQSEVQAVATTPMQVDKSVLVEKLLDDDRCYGCDLSGVDLSGKNLDDVDLEGSDLSGAQLEGVDLSGANLKGVSFKNANLRNADLSEADMYKADFSGADLTGADFEEALYDEADFTGSTGFDSNLVLQ